MFGRSRRHERAQQHAADEAMSHGPVDVAALRATITDVLGTRPPGAAHVVETRVRKVQYPGHPEHDLDCSSFQLTPRAEGALEVVVDVLEHVGSVVVFVAEDNPIELTAPIEIDNIPSRPFLDVVREVLLDVSRGEVDVARWPDGSLHDLRYRRDEGHRPADGPGHDGIVWSAAAAWD